MDCPQTRGDRRRGKPERQSVITWLESTPWSAGTRFGLMKAGTTRRELSNGVVLNSYVDRSVVMENAMVTRSSKPRDFAFLAPRYPRSRQRNRSVSLACYGAMCLATGVASIWAASCCFNRIPTDECVQLGNTNLFVRQGALHVLTLARTDGKAPFEPRDWEFLGFVYYQESGRQYHGRGLRYVAIPLWSILLLLMSYPLLVTTLRLRRRFRQPKGDVCSVCSYPRYGLSGNRCPECGTPFRPSEVGGAHGPPGG